MSESETELSAVKEILLCERKIQEAREKLGILQSVRPCPPKAPEIPKRQDLDFTPIPYPTAPPVDFGWPIWYKISLALLIAIVISWALFLIGHIAKLHLPDPIGSATYFIAGFSGLLAWLAIVSFLKGFFGDDKRPERYEAKFKSSPEYICKCHEIDEANSIAYQNACAEADRSYQDQVIAYETKAWPEYQAQLQEYEHTTFPKWEQSIQSASETVARSVNQLSKSYCKAGIPDECRNLEAMECVCSCMESQSCDLTTAIAVYQRQKMSALLQETLGTVSELAIATNEIAEAHQEAIGRLESGLEDTNQALESSKRWNMATAAAAGYAALKSKKISKQLKDMERQ